MRQPPTNGSSGLAPSVTTKRFTETDLRAKSVSIRFGCPPWAGFCLNDKAWLIFAKAKVTARDSVAPAVDGPVSGDA